MIGLIFSHPTLTCYAGAPPPIELPPSAVGSHDPVAAPLVSFLPPVVHVVVL